MKMSNPSATTRKGFGYAAVLLNFVTLDAIAFGTTLAALIVIDLAFLAICMFFIALHVQRRAQAGQPTVSETPKTA